MPPPLVVKLGGDALASPERIVAAARRLAERRRTGPVVAVASARRGVTDHLLDLVERVRDSALSPATAGGEPADISRLGGSRRGHAQQGDQAERVDFSDVHISFSAFSWDRLL